MILSLCLETFFPELPFYDRFEAAARAGFQAVEFWSWSNKDLDRVRDLLKRHALTLASMSGDLAQSMVARDEAEAYLAYARASVDAARFLDCPNLVVHSNRIEPDGAILQRHEELAPAEKYFSMFDVLQELKTIGEANHVTFLLEALNTKVDHQGNFLWNTADSACLTSRVGSAAVKVLFDAYHMAVMGEPIVQTCRKYLDEIRYIHIADAPGRHEPDTGRIDYDAFFQMLKESRFDGFVGLELYPLHGSCATVAALRRRWQSA